MRFRNHVLLFLVLTLMAVALLCCLPGTQYTISSGEGIETTNGYWLWLAGGVFVAVGCALEYFWIKGFDRIETRLTRRQKAAVGAVSIGVAAFATIYSLFLYYRH